MNRLINEQRDEINVTMNAFHEPGVDVLHDTVPANALPVHQAYIPRVQYEVEKAMGFKIFLDIDMTNSFHQFPLTELSSQRLAIQSPWGLVDTIFLPEGVSSFIFCVTKLAANGGVVTNPMFQVFTTKIKKLFKHWGVMTSERSEPYSLARIT